MPKKIMRRNVKRKRNFRRKTYKKRHMGMVPRKNIGMFNFNLRPPFKAKAILGYVQSTTLAAGTALGSSNLFNLNSCYDPDGTGAGHQPYYFDQFATLYDKYLVYGCHIKITFSVVELPAVPLMCYLAIYNGDAPSTGVVSTILEEKRVKKFIIHPTQGVKSYTMGLYVDIPRYLEGRKSMMLNQEDYWSSVSSNPTN